ncbi:MAG: dihydrolipoyl dehydrogenase [Desulfobacteraceae bacterium]|nr:MAG: dihydrolipoyl dehydrogenase [Desulfobacteraceae bacterium]
MRKMDAIIIGSGQGGVPLATELARSGKQVGIFERSRFGGSCTNWGCTPSKAFLGAAHAAGRARAAAGLGVHAQVQVDFGQVMQRVRRIRDSFTQNVEERLQQENLTVVQGEAAFTPEGHVRCHGQDFSAPLIVIDTGSSAATPPVKGLADTPFLTDRTFWDLTRLPERTLVMGGGYVGLELGQGIARLGSKVSIIDRSERLMSRESPEVGVVLAQALARDGVELHLGVEIEQVSFRDGRFSVRLSGPSILEGEALLVAAGRRPNTAALNAPAAGIQLDGKGFVQVNDHFETTRAGVYAIGEAAGQPAFTHVSWEDYRRLQAILNDRPRSRDDRVLGYAVFTDPQVGRTGLSLEQARRKGIRARDARMEVKNMARAIEWGHELGFYQMVIDEDSGRILGATLVGYEAGELVHVFMDLIEAGATWELLERAQHIHPTYAENLPSLARIFKSRG